MHVAKIKVLISCMLTAQLFCMFVFPYAISRFSHDLAHLQLYPKRKRPMSGSDYDSSDYDDTSGDEDDTSTTAPV